MKTVEEGNFIKNNHIRENGKLLQTNKKFSQLKNTQKEWISLELNKLYHEKMKERYTTRKLPAAERDAVISSLYDQIESREIWIPYAEVENYTISRTSKIVKSFKKQFPKLFDEIERKHNS